MNRSSRSFPIIGSVAELDAFVRIEKSSLRPLNWEEGGWRKHIHQKAINFLPIALCIVSWCASLSFTGQAQEALLPEVQVGVQTLRDKSKPVELREGAARTLGHSGPSVTVIGVLGAVLRDKTEGIRVRRASVAALTDIGRNDGGAQQAVLVLLKAVSDRRPALDPVRAASAGAIGQILQNSYDESIAKGAVPVLVDALSSPDPDPLVRASAAGALGRIGGQGSLRVADSVSIKALVESIRVTQVNVGQAAAQSLIRMYRTAVPELIRTLSGHNDANFRWNIAWIFGEIGPDAKDAIPSLTSLLQDADEDPNVRGAAAWAIGMIGQAAKQGTANFPGTVTALNDVLGKKDDDPNVRSNAAWALGRLGSLVRPDNVRFPDAVAATLVEAIRDADADIRRNAVWALGQIHPNPKKSAPPLAFLLTQGETDARVRREVVLSLGLIGPFDGDTKTSVPALCAALKDEDLVVRRFAATSLGQLGTDAQGEIQELLDLSHKPKGQKTTLEKDVRWAAAGAVASIADALRNASSLKAIEQLQSAGSSLGRDGYHEYSDHVKDVVAEMRSAQLFNQLKGFLEWLQKYRVMVLAACGYILAWLILYWKYPLVVYRINETLAPYAGVKLPVFLGGIPLSYLMLGGILHYRPRVLDAWVGRHIGVARKRFEKKLTIEQRRVHVDLPVLLEGKALPALRSADLRDCFDGERTYVLISGEGGAGKTSLACQLCKWAMDPDPALRLCTHAMLPIFLEQHNLEIEQERGALLENIRAELWYLVNTTEAPSIELVERLLKNRRILLVVDGMSEMTEAKRNAIQPGKPQFASRALVLTSRLEERPSGADLTVVRTMRVKRDRLSTFMDAYLVQRSKKDLFSDVEYFDYLGRLSRLVQERDITVLLAKLYADQLIALKDGLSRRKLAENIPDLMLEYLNELYGKVETRQIDDKLMHRAAKIIAWQCMKQTFRSMPAGIDLVVNELKSVSDNPSDILRLLETDLRIVQTIGAGKDQIDFTLDPLAEYLAALWLVEACGRKEREWRRVLAKIDASPGAPDAIAGFILALRDCCVVKGEGFAVPAFLAAELSCRMNMQEKQIETNVALGPQC